MCECVIICVCRAGLVGGGWWGGGFGGRGRVFRGFGAAPSGLFALKLICTTALNWLQQLINVLESWHKKFI